MLYTLLLMTVAVVGTAGSWLLAMCLIVEWWAGR